MSVPDSAARAQPPASTVVPPAVTVETVEALRKQAAEATDLDADTKQKVEATCALILEGLNRIAEVTGQSEKFKNDADNVQQRVEEAREILAKLQKARPAIPTDLTLAELEQEVSRKEVVLSERKAEHAKAEAERANRIARRREIRALLLSSSQRIAEVDKQLETAAPADEQALLTSVRRAELQVRRNFIEAEHPALQNELSKYDAEDSADLLRVEIDNRAREVALATSELELLQGTLSERRSADSAAAVQRAQDEVKAVPDALKPHAQANVTLAEAAHELSQPIEDTRLKLERTKLRLENVQKQFTATQQRVDDIGLTGSVGALLRRQRVDLPDLRKRRLNIQTRKATIEEAQYKLFEYDDMRSVAADAALQQVLAETTGRNKKEFEQIKASAKSIVDQRREHLDSVIRNLNAYIDTLFELDGTEQLLIRETERYENYIDERVLWIRSNRTLFSSFAVDASDTWAFDLAQWREVGGQMGEDLRAYPLFYVCGIFVFLFLLLRKSRFRREIEAVSQSAERGSCAKFSPTIQAAVRTLMLAITWPSIIFFLAWRLNVSSNGSQFARAMAQALLAVGWVCFPMEVLRRVCRQRGLADSHFDWPESTIRVLRSNLRWATPLGLIFVYATTLLYASDPEHGLDSIERTCYVAGMLILAVFMRRVMRPDTGIFREYLEAHRGGWFDRLKTVWYWGSVLAPLTIAGMTVTGFYYTAQQLSWRLYATVVFVFAVQLLRAFLQRLLLVQRRAMNIERARERRENAAKHEVGEVAPLGPQQIVPIIETNEDVDTNTEQSQRLLRTGLIAASFVGIWLIWVDVLPALRILDEWPVWTTTVKATATAPNVPRGGMSMMAQPPKPESTQPASNGSPDVVRAVTLADIGLAILLGVVTFVCARNIPGLMEITLLKQLPLDKSIRYAITSVTSYGIVLLGVILSFNAISVGWSKVQWLATALTFGLAFGLQEIFANFVAGLILLFERPIRVGDVVTVDDVTGVVSRIRIRATTITNWDRKEYVIPNKEFITGRMLNWTLSDKTNRIVINVGIAYGSDVQQAKDLLLQACQEHPLILDDPPTRVTFEGFGDNSLSLVVRTFLPDLDNRLTVVDDLHSTIERAFRRANLEIAFPQRDLHIRSVDPSVLNVVGGNSHQHVA